MNAAGALRRPVKLAELFPPESIQVDLDQSTKPAVIEALVHHAASLGRLPGEAERPVVDAILRGGPRFDRALGMELRCRTADGDRSTGSSGWWASCTGRSPLTRWTASRLTGSS